MLRCLPDEPLLRLAPRFLSHARLMPDEDARRIEIAREMHSGAAADLNVHKALDTRRLRTHCAAAARALLRKLRADAGMV